MIDGAIICITNEGIFEKGKLDAKNWYTIDRITLKTVDRKRLTRYAVCQNGRWISNQHMTLREAREFVERLKYDYSKPVFKPIPIDEMWKIAKEKGVEQAYNILLLGGYGFIEGTCKDYDELLHDFERMMKNAVRQEDV